MSGAKGVEALAEFQRASEAIWAKKASFEKPSSVQDDDDVQILRSSKRKATPVQAPSASKKKTKVFGPSLKDSPSSSRDLNNVLTKLVTTVFPLTPVLLASKEDSSAAILSLQHYLLQVIAQLYHLGERMEDKTSVKAKVDVLASQLHVERDKVLAREKEIKGRKLKLKNQDEAGILAASENASLREQLGEGGVDM